MQKAFLTVLTVLTLTCCLATTGASAQAGKINEKDLVGTWTLVSIQNTLPDGKKAEGFGAGDGMAVFDSNGKFVQALSRHDIPKVASNNRNTATPEEGKAIVQNSLILYGTYSFDSAGMLILHVDRSTRLLHFSATSLAIGAAAFTVSAALRRYLFPNGQPLWATIFTALALAPPGAVVVQQSLRLFAPQALPYVSLGELTAQVLTINLFIGTIAWALLRHTDRSEDGARVRAEPRITEPSYALRAKLPVTLRHAAILALSAEDHYVRVRTDRGQALILINLAGAIEALGPHAGVRIHRSHWIAREVATSVTSRSSRAGVRLEDATILPISRAGRKLLNGLRSL